jgi:hypothetical protein
VHGQALRAAWLASSLQRFLRRAVVAVIRRRLDTAVQAAMSALEERRMVDTVTREAVAHLVEPERFEILDVMGPTIQFLTSPEADDLWPCVMRGTIPPGVDIPLHSHRDPETFVAISGEVEGLVDAPEGMKWVRITPGDVFHVPSGARHAFRNQGPAPAVTIISSTSKIARFFQELGTPVSPGVRPSGPPSGEAIRRFLETAERYGYWNATPEENAQVGITLPGA